MKITQKKLQQIIKEEVAQSVKEQTTQLPSKITRGERVPTVSNKSARAAQVRFVDEFVKAQAPVLSRIAQAANEKTQNKNPFNRAPATGLGGSNISWVSGFLRNPEFQIPKLNLNQISLQTGINIGDKVSMPNLKLVVEKGVLHGFTLGGNIGEGMQLDNVFVGLRRPIRIGSDFAAVVQGGYTRHQQNANAPVEKLANAKVGLNYQLNPRLALQASIAGKVNPKATQRTTQNIADFNSSITLRGSF